MAHARTIDDGAPELRRAQSRIAIIIGPPARNRAPELRRAQSRIAIIITRAHLAWRAATELDDWERSPQPRRVARRQPPRIAHTRLGTSAAEGQS
jgi:hypothetical protein